MIFLRHYYGIAILMAIEGSLVNKSVATKPSLFNCHESSQSPERKIQSECGLFAIYFPDGANGLDLSTIAYNAGLELQHRAEGAVGMYVSNGVTTDYLKDLGIVKTVFKEGRQLPSLENPKIAMIHTRYPTSGGSGEKENTQPFNIGDLWFSHHGNLTNTTSLGSYRGVLESDPSGPNSDSWIAFNEIIKANGDSIEEKLMNAQKKFEGAWAFALTDGKKLVASKDRHSTRPFFLGYIHLDNGQTGYALSVETCVFDKMGITEYREILPGETLTIDEAGEKTIELNPQKDRRDCIFEFVYMMNPNSRYLGRDIYFARREAGQLLWHESPIGLDNDKEYVIVPVPDTARPGAYGYFTEAKKALGDRVTFEELIVANRNYGRNFIKPEKGFNPRKARDKFYIVEELARGKNLVVLEDSFVRGDTLKYLSQILHEAGANEVHGKATSPEVVNPCYWGVAMETYEELLAYRFPEIKDREKYLRVESLSYLSLHGLKEACGAENSYCAFCFGGESPEMTSNGIVSLVEK